MVSQPTALTIDEGCLLLTTTFNSREDPLPCCSSVFPTFHRITEWLRFRRTSGCHLVQPHCTSPCKLGVGGDTDIVWVWIGLGWVGWLAGWLQWDFLCFCCCCLCLFVCLLTTQQLLCCWFKKKKKRHRKSQCSDHLINVISIMSRLFPTWIRKIRVANTCLFANL